MLRVIRLIPLMILAALPQNPYGTAARCRLVLVIHRRYPKFINGFSWLLSEPQLCSQIFYADQEIKV